MCWKCEQSLVQNIKVIQTELSPDETMTSCSDDHPNKHGLVRKSRAARFHDRVSDRSFRLFKKKCHKTYLKVVLFNPEIFSLTHKTITSNVFLEKWSIDYQNVCWLIDSSWPDKQNLFSYFLFCFLFQQLNNKTE